MAAVVTASVVASHALYKLGLIIAREHIEWALNTRRAVFVPADVYTEWDALLCDNGLGDHADQAVAWLETNGYIILAEIGHEWRAIASDLALARWHEHDLRLLQRQLPIFQEYLRNTK